MLYSTEPDGGVSDPRLLSSAGSGQTLSSPYWQLVMLVSRSPRPCRNRPMRPFPTLLACAALPFNGPGLPAQDAYAGRDCASAAIKNLGDTNHTNNREPGQAPTAHLVF